MRRDFAAKAAAFPCVVPTLILGTAILAHWGAIHGGTVEAEDYVRMFSGSLHGGWQGWSKLFSPDYFQEFNSGLYRPLQSVYFYMGWLCFGSNIELYQWSKIVLLWASSLLVFRLGVHILGEKTWALLAALLYVSHPVHTGALLYVGKTEDLLMVSFFLLTFWCHWRGRSVGGPHPLWTVCTSAAFALALAAKETAIVLPGCLIFFDMLHGSRASDARLGLRLCLHYLALMCVAAAYLAALAWIGQHIYGAFGLAWESPFWNPALRLAAHVTWLWVPWTGRNHLSAGALVLGALFLAGMVVPDWIGGTRRRALFLMGWIMLSLFPIMNVFSTDSLTGYLAQQAIQPWRLLLPAIGFCWLAAVFLQHLAGRWGRAAVCISLLWLHGHLLVSRGLAAEHGAQYAHTVIRGEYLHPGYVFKNSRFYGVMLSLPSLRLRQPELVREIASSVAHRLSHHSGPTIVDLFSRDAIYQDTKTYIHVLEALSHKGVEAFHRDLARLDRERPLGDSASEFARRLGEAARLKDDGVALFQQGRRTDSVRVLERSLTLNPDNIYTLISIAAVRFALKNPSEALAALDHALDLPGAGPFRGMILGSRAQVLQALGRPREAERDRWAVEGLASSAVKNWR